ncbi:tetratricopeptide repeat protein [Caldimonas brevitalea]|uniref:Cytochrome c heme lyase subunit CcmH n=1 Tax=Caldimonas brevitalea TaxID=413882 RepID=A0A0G3BK28_9BURK|nr:tetratricopeptide repeat protein [Caldimonas brevitalea]AKJ28323.1 cytochrome c heme lyase subunit CcmH [Caldimonas brevitalea]
MSGPLAAFWVAAGGLTLLTVLALWWPLGAQRGAGHSGASGWVRPAGWVLAVGIPLATAFLYLQLGAPRTLEAAAQPPAHRLNEADMASAVETLAQRLKSQPDDLQGWFMLARSYQAMQRWPDAAAAYRETVRLAPDEPQLLADLADVLATVQGGSLEGEPRQLLERALKLAPDHPKSLALAAIAEFRQQRYAVAIGHWERLLAGEPAASEGAEVARRGIAQARALMGTAPSP